MDKNIKELYEVALKARENAYTPLSSFKVGVALKTKSGKIIQGANIENGVPSVSACAEQSALYAAIAMGEREFEEVMVVTDMVTPSSPCGVCRQTMAEFCRLDIKIHCANLQGDFFSTTLKDIFPKAYTPDHLY